MLLPSRIGTQIEMFHRSFSERMAALSTMSDTKTKPAAKGSSAKQSKLWNLICLAREVGGDIDGIHEYVNFVDDKKRLERELGERRKEVAELNDELAQCKATAKTNSCVLMQQFGEQYKLFNEMKVASEAQYIELQKVTAELTTMKENNASCQTQLVSLESNIKSMKNANATLQQKVNEMETECAVHRAQLQSVNAQKDRLEITVKTELGSEFFHGCDALREKRFCDALKSLSDFSYAIVREFIAKSEVIPAAGRWQSLQSRFPDLPLPNESSREALLMRHAACQAIISDVLIQHVFRPFYIASDFRQEAEKMLAFFDDGMDQQNIYRCQVFKALNDAEIGSSSEAASEADEAICSWLDRLVLPGHVEEFRMKINEFSRKAVEIWAAEAQRSKYLVEVGHPTEADGQLKTYKEFGSRDAGTNGNSGHSIVATLFPRITMNGKVLHSGVVVWSDSPATLIAKDQLPTATMRRMSTSQKNGRRNSVIDRSTT